MCIIALFTQTIWYNAHMQNVSTQAMVKTLNVNAIGIEWLVEVASVYTKRALRMEWHRHVDAELICCTRGVMTYEFRRHGPVSVKAGEFLVIPADIDHRLAAGIDAPSRRISLLLKSQSGNRAGFSPFSADDYSELMANLLSKKSCPERIHGELLAALARIGGFIHRADGGLSALELCEVRIIASSLLFYCAQTSPFATVRDSDDIMHRAVEWMNAHFAEDIDIDHIVSRIGYGRTQFFRLFKEKTGLSPTDYLIRLRMEKAKELLAVGDLSVREIAARTGFSDAAFFSRTFARRVGAPPSTWRPR